MHPSPSATRRTVLTLGSLVPLGLAAGCTGTSSSPGGEAPRTDPDEALLDEVRSSTSNLRTQVDVVMQAPDGQPAAAALGALRSCLDVHLAQLGRPDGAAATAGATAAPAPATSVVPTFAGVLEAARTHRVTLTDACARAESGGFARLLACAAAGITQHLVAVEAAAPKGGGR